MPTLWPYAFDFNGNDMMTRLEINQRLPGR